MASVTLALQQEYKNALRATQRNEEQERVRRFFLRRRAPLKVRMLAARAQKDIDRYIKAAWIVAYAIAFGAEGFDLVATIPIFGLPFSFFAGVLHLSLAIFIWRKTSFAERRLLRVGIALLDTVPIIGLLPLSVLNIYWLQKYMNEKKDRAEKILKKIHKNYIL